MKTKTSSMLNIPGVRLFQRYLLLVALLLSSLVLVMSLPISTRWTLAYASIAGLVTLAGGIAFTFRFAKQAKGR